MLQVIRREHMETYIESIRFAFLVFPFIAFLFTLPYILMQYHKYGSILFQRVAIVYSFILYLTCIYFLVILPLPSIETVANLDTPWVQLIPFSFVRDFFLNSSFVWNDFSTYLAVIKEPYFYQVFYNILLTVPFGIYLRYYFNCSFGKTLFFSFLLTLFFEGTQLSGLYGIYPRPYRLFDIDDLFLNTLGGTIGYGITPIVKFFLPERQKLDELSYEKGKKISILRRFVAVWIDILAVILFTLLFDMIGINDFWLQYVLAIIFIFMLIPMVQDGATLGKKFVNVKLVTLEEENPKWYQFWIRYGLLYLILLPSPYYLFLISSILSRSTGWIWILFFLMLFVYFIFFLHACISLFSKKLFWYEKMSKTKNKSTIIKEEE